MAGDIRSGHGIPLDMDDDPFVKGLVEYTQEALAEIDGQDDVETEARIINVGFDTLRDLGLTTTQAFDLASQQDLLDSAIGVSTDLGVQQSEMVALLL